MKLALAAAALIFTLACQTSNITISKQADTTSVQFVCSNFGDTQFEAAYDGVEITCYGGKLSKQASRIIGDVVSLVINALVPQSLWNKLATPKETP